MTLRLPLAFVETPIAHRALHDTFKGRPENSVGAIKAAIEANYAIEIDIQQSSDSLPMVFHDYDLGRLTKDSGPVNQRSAKTLNAIPLIGGGDAGIPTLSDVLDMVAGQVPLLIEIKDQDGALGPEVGPLEAAVAELINKYTGPLAVMSFNPHSVAAMQTLAPDVPRGLVTEYFREDVWKISADRLKALTHIADYDRVGASFISHNWRDLQCHRVRELKAQGARILTWTIRSPEQELNARQIAENITFEGYLPLQQP